LARIDNKKKGALCQFQAPALPAEFCDPSGNEKIINAIQVNDEDFLIMASSLPGGDENRL
jgi:hypothetical protein